MSNILEINNWNQLVRARSDYENLRIVVNQYNNDSLVGTKIQIVDYNTNDVYLTLFTEVTSSTVIPTTVSMELPQIVDIINSYGFNVRISEPEVVSDKVLKILQGLYEAGYLYVFKNYVPACINDTPHIRGTVPSKWKMFVCASKQISHPSTYIDRHDVLISDSPSFVEDEWDWVRPLRTYPIHDILETGTVDNGLST